MSRIYLADSETVNNVREELDAIPEWAKAEEKPSYTAEEVSCQYTGLTGGAPDVRGALDLISDDIEAVSEDVAAASDAVQEHAIRGGGGEIADYLEEEYAATLQTLQALASPRTFCFAFMTDLHMSKQGSGYYENLLRTGVLNALKVTQRLSKEFPLSMAVLGGDYMQLPPVEDGGTLQDGVDVLMEINRWMAGMDCPRMVLAGQHEGDCLTSKAAAWEFTSSQTAAAEFSATAGTGSLTHSAGDTIKVNTAGIFYHAKWTASSYWLLSGLALSGKTGMLLQFLATGTGTSPANWVVEYSADGAVWTELTNYTLQRTVQSIITAALPQEAAVDGLSIRFRPTDDVSVGGGTVSATGNNYLGDIVLTAEGAGYGLTDVQIYNYLGKKYAREGTKKSILMNNYYRKDEDNGVMWVFLGGTLQDDLDEDTLVEIAEANTEGYPLLFFCHYGLEEDGTVTPYIETFLNLLPSYNQTAIAWICGGNHADQSAYVGSTPVISCLQSGHWTSNPSQDGVTYEHEKGTATESAMSVFTVDPENKKLYCTRFGLGQDRQWTYA